MRTILKQVIKKILNKAILNSNTNRNENRLANRLMEIVPDISNQYTTTTIDMKDELLVNRVYCQHAFQMSIALKTIELFIAKNTSDIVTVVDIGDSAGTHLIYLQELMKDQSLSINALSVNLDKIAVEKIKSKGLNAICCRAEELHTVEGGGIKADIFMSFEMLEHLFDPISFLHSMATKAECEYFVITVPYLTKSRVGMHHIRQNLKEDRLAENTHIFELCPEDWDLIFQFSGWEIVYSDRYTQYPKSGILNLTKYIWRKFDFDGFYGVILKRNLEISNRYRDW